MLNSISGQREANNSFMVNGGNVEETFSNGAAVIPNLDSIAEFRIITNNFDAHGSLSSGGIATLLRSNQRTNLFHGDLFEFSAHTESG